MNQKKDQKCTLMHSRKDGLVFMPIKRVYGDEPGSSHNQHHCLETSNVPTSSLSPDELQRKSRSCVERAGRPHPLSTAATGIRWNSIPVKRALTFQSFPISSYTQFAASASSDVVRGNSLVGYMSLRPVSFHNVDEELDID